MSLFFVSNPLTSIVIQTASAQANRGGVDTGDAVSLGGTTPRANRSPTVASRPSAANPTPATTLDPATVHYQRIPLEEHTTLHKVQIRDLPPTEVRDIELFNDQDTIVQDVEFALGDSRPTVAHDVELTYIDHSIDDEPEILAVGQIVEPELLIKTDTENIIVERIHPAYIIADHHPPEDESLKGKNHMNPV